jgi:hypothetical protein
MTQMRELTDRELDAVCGGFFDIRHSFNTVNQGNTQVALQLGSGNISLGGANIVQAASNVAVI